MSFLTGKPGALKRLEGVPEDAYGTAANYYKGLLGNDSEDFNAFAKPELRRFNEQTIPDIAEQFAGSGGGGQGALSSSGFRNASINASTDLSERLGEIRARLRQSGAQGLTDIANQGNYYEQGQPGAVDSLGAGIGSVVGEYGPEIGGAIGSIFESLSYTFWEGLRPSQTLPAGGHAPQTPLIIVEGS